MAQNLKNDEQFNQQLQQYYDRALTDINKTIDAEYDKFSDPEAARKAVSQMDVQAYQNTAKDIVAKAEEMRKAGKTVTYGDFSDEVNARLKVYNATMRINRLENLKSQIGAEMLNAHLDVQSAVSDKLTDDYQAEIKRQAGIMGETTEGKFWTSQQVAKTVMKQSHGANFSKRIWANQDALKAELDGIVSTGIIRGESPRKMATRMKAQIKDSVTNHKYVTERIARTESARVQYTAQIDSIKKNGYQFVQWFAEPKACVTCRSIARKDNGYGEGIYKIDKVPLIPDDTHPNCRCAISETWVDGENSLNEKGSKANDKQTLSDDELLERFANEQIIKVLGRKASIQFVQGLSHAPEPLQKMYAKYSKSLKLDAVNESGASYYSPRTKGVTIDKKSINLSGADADRKPMDVVYHEFGHLIDDVSLNGTNEVSARSTVTESDIKLAIDNDWNAYNDNLAKNINTLDDLEKLGNDSVYSSDFFYGGVRLRYKKDGTFTAVTKRNLGAELHFDQLAKERKQNGWLNYTDISDMVEAETKGKYRMGYGHGKSYWKYYGMQEKEFFAECSSATINNPGSLSVIKKHFPSAYKKYLELVEQIGGSNDE